MEPRLREGAARLSWETGPLLVPVTIAGAYRAWPHFQALPRPARIRVRYHEAIDPAPYRGQPEEVALPALLAELQRRVDRSLQPGVKADLRMMLLYAAPAPLPRAHEVAAAALVAIVLLLHGRGPASLLPSAAYLGYLGLDWRFVPQSRLAKWIRNVSPVVLLLASGPALLRALGSPPVPAGAALVAILAGAIYPYVYVRRRTAMTFLRGMVLAFALEGAAQALWPSPAGPHAALAPAGTLPGRDASFPSDLPVVEGDVPDRGRLFLDPRLSAGHRVPRRRAALAPRHPRPGAGDAVRGPAHLQPGRLAQPARPGQHPDARGAAAAMEGEGVRARPPRLRFHRFHHHDHALRRRRQRPHRREPVRARRRPAPGGRDPRPARVPGCGLPQGVPRSHRLRGADRGPLPRPQRRAAGPPGRGRPPSSGPPGELAAGALRLLFLDPEDDRPVVAALPEARPRPVPIRDGGGRDSPGAPPAP